MNWLGADETVRCSAAWYIARNYAEMRLAELGDIAGGVTDPPLGRPSSDSTDVLNVDRGFKRRLKAARQFLRLISRNL
jgi:hypothetical protein